MFFSGLAWGTIKQFWKIVNSIYKAKHSFPHYCRSRFWETAGQFWNTISVPQNALKNTEQVHKSEINTAEVNNIVCNQPLNCMGKTRPLTWLKSLKYWARTEVLNRGAYFEIVPQKDRAWPRWLLVQKYCTQNLQQRRNVVASMLDYYS